MEFLPPFLKYFQNTAIFLSATGGDTLEKIHISGVDRYRRYCYYKFKLKIIFKLEDTPRMKTPEVLARIDIPRHKLYYLEQKGYISPKKTVVGEKTFRDYSEEDVRKIECIWKYLKKGFKYKIAYEKAMEELSNPQMELLKDR